MADLQKTIEIVFSALDQTGQGFQSVTSNIDALAADVEKVTGPISDVTKDILAFEAGVAALGIAVLAYSSSAAVGFQSAQIDLQKVLTDSETDVDAYAAAITNLSQEFGVFGTDVTQVTADFKQAGFDIDEALQLTASALTAVKVSELDTNEASQILISTLKGFGLDVSDTTHILDSLNEVSNNNAASFSELGAAVSTIAPVANAAGLSFDELVGFVTPIIEIFGSGTESANGLKAVLVTLADPTKAATDALSALGISLIDVDGTTKSSKDLLKELAEVWPTLTNEVALNTAANLAGKEQASKFIALMEGWPSVQDAVSDSINSTGSAAQELEVRMAATEEVINQTKVALQGAAVVIGSEFLAETTGAIDAVGDLAAAFTTVVSSGGLEPLFDLLRPLLSEFETDLQAIAENLPAAFEAVDWTALINAFSGLGTAIGELFGNIDLTTAEGLADALQTLVNVGATMIEWTTGVVEGLEPFAELLGAVVDEVGDLNPDIAQLIGNIAGFATGLDATLPLVDGISSVISGLGDAVILLAGAKALGVLPTSLGTATTSLTAFSVQALAASAAVAGSGALGYAIGTVLADAIDKAIPGVDTLGTKIHELVSGDQDDWLEQTTTIADVLPKQAEATEDAADATEKLAEQLGYASVEALEEAEATELVNDNLREMTEYFDLANQAIEDQAVALGANADAFNDNLVVMEETNTQGGYLVTTQEDLFGNIQITSEKIAEQADTMDENAKKTLEATKAANDFAVEMEEIASNERIQTLSLAIDLNIAQLEAETEQIKAAFDSIDGVISATTSSITGLFDTLADVDANSRTWNEILEQIEKENEIREDELELQKELIDQQIKYYEAKTTALQNGDALIKIEADGLEPEIEAFMFEILERIQVRASEEGQEFLLGCTL